MKLKHEVYDQVAVVNISGEMTVDELQPLQKLFENCLSEKTRDFVLDLAETHFIDSRGLETLLWLQEQADELLGQVRLATVSENIRKILEITRLEHHFDLHQDVESAVKSLR
jgi:anti-sigma B factor antagonist